MEAWYIYSVNTYMCVYMYSNQLNESQYPGKKPANQLSRAPVSPPIPAPQRVTSSYSDSVDLCDLSCPQCTRVTQSGLFCVWLLWLSIMFMRSPRLSHVATVCSFSFPYGISLQECPTFHVSIPLLMYLPKVSNFGQLQISACLLVTVYTCYHCIHIYQWSSWVMG